jgi:hypothetical protein
MEDSASDKAAVVRFGWLETHEHKGEFKEA